MNRILEWILLGDCLDFPAQIGGSFSSAALFTHQIRKILLKHTKISKIAQDLKCHITVFFNIFIIFVKISNFFLISYSLISDKSINWILLYNYQNVTKGMSHEEFN